MRKTIRISMFVLLMVVVLGCSNQADAVAFEDIVDEKVVEGTTVKITGEVAFFTENEGEAALDIDGPTQLIALVNENSIALTVYNELDVTGEEIKQGESYTVEGEVRDIEEDKISVIQATKIKEE